MVKDEQKPAETTEVHETKNADGETVERTVTTTEDQGKEKLSKRGVAERVVYYIGGVIMALLAARLILALLGANRDNPFAALVFDISEFFARPFFGLFQYEPELGTSVFELGTLVGIIVYGLLTIAVAQLINLTRR